MLKITLSNEIALFVYSNRMQYIGKGAIIINLLL